MSTEDDSWKDYEEHVSWEWGLRVFDQNTGNVISFIGNYIGRF